MKAISTVLSYIVLLGITLILLVFTLNSFVDFQLQIKKPMADSLNASRTISNDYATLIGMSDPEIEVNKTYSGPEDSQLSIETFPPYSIDDKGMVAIKIKNPTSKLMKIPELTVTSDLFEKTYEDLNIIYTHTENIYFTPNSAGNLTITAECGEREWKEVITILEEDEVDNGEDGISNKGASKLTVIEKKIEDLEDLEIKLNCTYNVSSEGKSCCGCNVGTSLGLGTFDHLIFIGKAEGSYRGGTGSLSGIGCSCDSFFNKYQGIQCWNIDNCRGEMGVRYTNGTMSVSGSAHGGNHPTTCSSGATVALAAIVPNVKIDEMGYIFERYKQTCAQNNLDNLVNNIPKACECANSFSTQFKHWTPESESVYMVDDQEPLLIEKGKTTPFKDGDYLTYSTKYTGKFQVSDSFVDTATLYLFTQKDINIILKVNNFPILKEWRKLDAYTTTDLDISGKVAPNNMDNTLEIWLSPEEEGDFPISWVVETK